MRFFFVQSQLNVSAQGTEYNGVLMRGNGGKFEYSQADRLIDFTISVQQTGKEQNVYEIAFKCGSVVFLPR